MTEHGKPEVGTEHGPNQLGITQADEGRAVDRDRSKAVAFATVQIRERPYPEIGDGRQHPTSMGILDLGGGTQLRTKAE